MSGNNGVSVDSATAKRGAVYLHDSHSAADRVSSATDSLGSAQSSAVWGHQRCPAALGNSSAEMFATVSDVMAKERDFIELGLDSLRAVLDDFTAAELDSAQAFEAVNQALQSVAGSSQAQALAQSLQAAGFLSTGADSGSVPASGGDVASSGGQSEGTQNAPAFSTPDGF